MMILSKPLHAATAKLFTVAVVCCLFGAARAQTAGTDSLQAVLAEQRALMVQADSAGNRQAAYETRLHLATLERKPEAAKLLRQAAAMADSMDRPDLEAMARRLLGKRLAASGSYAAAYAEASRGDSLQTQADKRETERWEDRRAMELQRVTSANDSLLQAASERERRLAVAMVELQKRSDGWMYGAIAALLAGLALVIGLLYRVGKAEKKRRAAVEDLRMERTRPRNAITIGTRSVSDDEAACTFPSPTTVVPPVHPVDEAMKPVASGMFRKDAPERIATLQDARQRGDNEKVLRVVATLKPYLLGVDADRFGPLIARLKATAAAAKAMQWNADLDTLEAALRELLAGRADH